MVGNHHTSINGCLGFQVCIYLPWKSNHQPPLFSPVGGLRVLSFFIVRVYHHPKGIIFFWKWWLVSRVYIYLHIWYIVSIYKYSGPFHGPRIFGDCEKETLVIVQFWDA